MKNKFKHSEETKKKMSFDRKGDKNPRFGKTCSEETKEKISSALKGRKPSEETKRKFIESRKGYKHNKETKEKISLSNKEEKSYLWKGGIRKTHVSLYETYAHQLFLIEEIRRDPKNEDFLQIKCTYCGKWINPKNYEVSRRLQALKGQLTESSECRFYCPGKICRSQCSIYGMRKYPKGYLNSSSREVQPELRKLVFERDKYTCQKCEEQVKSLHCHHIDPVSINPIESADIDNCITLCIDCHKEVHKLPKCTYKELVCKQS